LISKKWQFPYFRTLLVVLWLVLVFTRSDPFLLIIEYTGFSLLGVVGAIFANATGAGGGVIFVPFFNQLNFDPTTTVATSLAIQCCGMTAGALTWWAFYKKSCMNNPQWNGLAAVLYLTVPFSGAGIWAAQSYQYWVVEVTSADALHLSFGVFSIVLSLAIFATIPLLKKQDFKQHLSLFDYIALPMIGLLGGVVTAWLSIGIGELVAVFLIIRRFNVTFSIATAVILSAFSVWAGVIYHILVSQQVYWPVVIFAGAGAVIGGMLAKHLVLYFSATHLKVFFAAWVFILGISAMPY
jgi:uncharacterized membrane protein YfcA